MAASIPSRLGKRTSLRRTSGRHARARLMDSNPSWEQMASNPLLWRMRLSLFVVRISPAIRTRGFSFSAEQQNIQFPRARRVLARQRNTSAHCQRIIYASPLEYGCPNSLAQVGASRSGRELENPVQANQSVVKCLPADAKFSGAPGSDRQGLLRGRDGSFHVRVIFVTASPGRSKASWLHSVRLHFSGARPMDAPSLLPMLIELERALKPRT